MLRNTEQEQVAFSRRKTPRVCCAISAKTAPIFQEDLFQIFTRSATIFQENIPSRTAIQLYE